MTKQITQEEISMILNIPRCSVSVALRKTRPIRKSGKTQFYDTNVALNEIIAYFDGRIDWLKSECNKKVHDAEKVKGLAREAIKKISDGDEMESLLD